MTAIQVLWLALAGQLLLPGPSDLLESGYLSSWGALPMGAGSRYLIDGLPVSAAGIDRLPPWGSVEKLQVSSPLEGGLWSGGKWTFDIAGHSVPDSSYYTQVGLFQNTSDRHRYTGSLRRPLPGGVGLKVTAGREDSLRIERIGLFWRGMSAEGVAWRDEGDAYVAHLYGSPVPGTLLRASLSSPSAGDRWVEGLAEGRMRLAGAELSAGLAGALGEDSQRVEAHMLGRFPIGSVSLTARADLQGAADSIEGGGAAGILADLGPLGASAGALLPPGGDAQGVLSARYGPAEFAALLQEDLASAAIHAGGTWGLSRMDLMAGADSDDTLYAGMRVLPGVRIVNAVLRMGGRARLQGRAGGDWEVHGDAIASYSLSTFSMVLALEDLEDIQDGGSSFTYGVLWEFSDEAARPEQEEQGEGEG